MDHTEFIPIHEMTIRKSVRNSTKKAFRMIRMTKPCLIAEFNSGQKSAGS